MTDNLTKDIFFKFRETLRDGGFRDGKFFITGKKIYPIFEPTPSIIRFIFELDGTTFVLDGPLRYCFERIRWVGITPTEDQLILMKLSFL